VPVVRVTFRAHPQEKQRWHYLYGKLEEMVKEAGASETIGSPTAVVTPINSHAYGGTRMGEAADDSVIDKWNASHEVPNLTILGAPPSRPPPATTRR
jgi:gluconate 2-dehydrogenase alpha chain